MTESLNLTEIIEFKKTLKQLYPSAVKNIGGKDVIYLERAPGTDVAIYSDGTAVYSDSYTSTKPRLRRGGDVSKAFYIAYDEGYRPIYDPQGTWVSNRMATKKAEKQREMEMTSVFEPVQEIKRRPTPRRQSQEENALDISVPTPQVMRRMEPQYNLNTQQNDPNYFDKVLLSEINKQPRRGVMQPYWETPASAFGIYSKDARAAGGLENFIFSRQATKTAAQRKAEIDRQEKARKKQEAEMKKQLKKQQQAQEQMILQLSGGQML